MLLFLTFKTNLCWLFFLRFSSFGLKFYCRRHLVFHMTLYIQKHNIAEQQQPKKWKKRKNINLLLMHAAHSLVLALFSFFFFARRAHLPNIIKIIISHYICTQNLIYNHKSLVKDLYTYICLYCVIFI